MEASDCTEDSSHKLFISCWLGLHHGRLSHIDEAYSVHFLSPSSDYRRRRRSSKQAKQAQFSLTLGGLEKKEEKGEKEEKVEDRGPIIGPLILIVRLEQDILAYWGYPYHRMIHSKEGI